MMSVKVKGRNGLVISIPDQVASGLIAEGRLEEVQAPKSSPRQSKRSRGKSEDSSSK
ncbi:hypothetical protein [uncultured Varibaculum sp.]|uniref:hypothetical protein n=1 Tax=uncultured Varibaculum sp. TaxID=413896 RepID=UPI00288B10AE|nr:hypothetical protein [uncultured Varibaculum sp.]